MPPCLIHRGLRLKGAQGRSTARQARGEHRTFAQLAGHSHVSAHHARELARNGQPEAGAAEALRSRNVSLTEFLKHLRLLLSRHADARINHGELDPLSYSPRLQLDLTLFGELAGIAQ